MAPEELAREGRPIRRVYAAPGRQRVEPDVVQDRRHGQQLFVERPSAAPGDLARDKTAAQAVPLHRAAGAGRCPQPLQRVARCRSGREGVEVLQL